jgi:hypothetical protein
MSGHIQFLVVTVGGCRQCSFVPNDILDGLSCRIAVCLTKGGILQNRDCDVGFTEGEKNCNKRNGEHTSQRHWSYSMSDHNRHEQCDLYLQLRLPKAAPVLSYIPWDELILTD